MRWFFALAGTIGFLAGEALAVPVLGDPFDVKPVIAAMGAYIIAAMFMPDRAS